MIQSTPQFGQAQAKPQANIYTLLIVVAVLCMLIAAVIGMRSLTAKPSAGYGLSGGALLSPDSLPEEIQPKQ